MKRLGMKKNRWKSLDMIHLTLADAKEEIVVFINSPLFFRSVKYVFHGREDKYSKEGVEDMIWESISLKKYQEASNMLDKALLNCSSNSLLFAKFVVSLFQKEEAYCYLKESIETKESNEYDDEYRLYLDIYGRIDKEHDIDVVLELLLPPKKIVAFNKNSYNGVYLEFQELLKSFDYKTAQKKLSICRKMRPDYLHLEILAQLMIILIQKEEEAIKLKKEQEKLLDQERCKKFINSVKDQDFVNAKEQLETIISYRNIENKNNYSYELFLEVLEMYFTFSNDIAFEIPTVSYTYKNEKDYFRTFLESISAGDFKTTLKVGKKCRNKAIDSSEPRLKVSLYLTILERIFAGIKERQKNHESLYYIVQSNIQRGHFIHALELYQENQVVLENYQSKLLLDLFQTGIAIEKKELNFSDICNQDKTIQEDKNTQLELSNTEIEKPENKKIIEEDNVAEDASLETKEEVKAEQMEEIFYPVEPLLKHIEPTQEYFIYYSKCMEYGQFEEAKYWLNQYGSVLRANQLEKRLDHYFYAAEVSYMESLEDSNLVRKKEELYQLSYNAMRNYDYERALTYLEYYEKMDVCRNTKALILKGYVYRKMGQYPSAMKCFIQANSISPNPDAYYFLGDIYYKLHKWKDAIFCYITYNHFYPKENITVYLNLSECYRRLENTPKSLKYLKIADELNLNQNRGLNLKNRILKAEIVNSKKEKFHLERNSKAEEKNVS